LCPIGVPARMAERYRPEEKIAVQWGQRLKGLIDIAEGPIRWVNVRTDPSMGDDRMGGVYADYGIPDSRQLPKVRIQLAPRESVWLAALALGAVMGASALLVTAASCGGDSLPSLTGWISSDEGSGHSEIRATPKCVPDLPFCLPWSLPNLCPWALLNLSQDATRRRRPGRTDGAAAKSRESRG